MNVCVWCQSAHDTPLALCPACDNLAARMRETRGEPLRVPRTDASVRA